jgi:hypothetical protein
MDKELLKKLKGNAKKYIRLNPNTCAIKKRIDRSDV